MAIYTISDLHLSMSGDKPMDIFGSSWGNYLEILKQNWLELIQPDDLVLIPGDISWAMYLHETEADFRFLHELPGEKLISKGNHDYWWETLKKLNDYVERMGFSSLHFMHNSIYQYGGITICAAKGYPDNGKSDEDKKLYQREVSRLKLSLETAAAAGAKVIYVMLHYPPTLQSEFAQLMESYGVSRCIYGHLHGVHHNMALEGLYNGVQYSLVAADYLQFKPQLLMK